jgi:hypothetical protein
MINYNELRIENWVKRNDMEGVFTIRLVCKDRVAQIHLIDHDFEKNAHFACECTLSELEPILLTAEWLEKFGFIESERYGAGDRYFRKDGFTGLADYGAQLIVLPEGQDAYLSCGYYENQIDCRYVHQLQNLHFALTGEELTIKEPA